MYMPEVSNFRGMTESCTFTWTAAGCRLSKVLSSCAEWEVSWQALEKFGDDVAIAFSGAEDVALIEYAHLTGRPFRVFR